MSHGALFIHDRIVAEEARVLEIGQEVDCGHGRDVVRRVVFKRVEVVDEALQSVQAPVKQRLDVRRCMHTTPDS